jgi:hypothetical protein
MDLTFLWCYLLNIFIFPGTVIPMLEAVLGVVPVDKLAVHFHDTYGQALSNILASLQVSNFFHHNSSWKQYHVRECSSYSGVMTDT